MCRWWHAISKASTTIPAAPATAAATPTDAANDSAALATGVDVVVEVRVVDVGAAVVFAVGQWAALSEQQQRRRKVSLMGIGLSLHHTCGTGAYTHVTVPPLR